MEKTHAERWSERDQRDDGFTLTEVLVAIVLLGVAVSVIIAALRTTIVVSQTSDEQAKVEAALTAAADRLTTTDYITCPDDTSDYHSEVGAAASVVGWPAEQIEIVEIQFWDPAFGQGGADVVSADGDWVADNTLVGAGCDDSAVFTTSRTLQRITIQATSPDGSLVRTLEVVKANICADAESTSCRSTT
ncbi:MAG: prepilin-type N-terminal cleavage/methylation domain-containing protein [Actinomycetota bacterium]